MFTGISLGVVVAIIAVIALLGIIASGYVKAPPDTAYIISGLRKKIIIGKSSIKIPFLERLDKLSLKLIPIDVKTEAAVPTADYINIQVDAAVNVKVSSEPEKLKQAAENFLNQNTQYIAQVAREVLEGNMREIVGRMRLEEMVSDRQKFADLVKENAEPDLAAMGLDVVSFNVQNFTDSNGVIDDLGIDNISQIKKKAAIAKAEAEKEIAVAKAEADKILQDAEAQKESRINEAEGQASRFNSMYEEYIKYPSITKQRMFYETMEDILPDMKVIIEGADGSQIQQLLPLDSFNTAEATEE